MNNGMKQAEELANEIVNEMVAISKSKSQYLRNDRLKNVGKMKADLKEYCYYRNLDFNKLCERFGI